MDGLAPSLGVSDTGCPLSQALAGPPITHTFSPQSTKYIFKKPQHNQASWEGPVEARAWPTGAEDRAWGSAEGTRGWGNYFGSHPAEFAVCPLLLRGWGSTYPVPVATSRDGEREASLEMSHAYVQRSLRGSHLPQDTSYTWRLLSARLAVLCGQRSPPAQDP